MGIGLRAEDDGPRSLRRTKAPIIDTQAGNLRAVQVLPGHTSFETTVRDRGGMSKTPSIPSERTEI